MKRIRQPPPAWTSYTSARLSRVDVEDFMHLFSSAGLSVRILDGRHEFDSLDELVQERGTHLDLLTLEGATPEGFGPRASIRIERDYLTCNSGGMPDGAGFAAILQARCERARPTWLRWMNALYGLWVLTSTMFFGYFLSRTVWLSVVVIISLYIIVAFLARRHLSGAWLRRAHEASIWNRYGATIIIGILCAIAGAAAKALFDAMLKKG